MRSRNSIKSKLSVLESEKNKLTKTLGTLAALVIAIDENNKYESLKEEISVFINKLRENLIDNFQKKSVEKEDQFNYNLKVLKEILKDQSNYSSRFNEILFQNGVYPYWKRHWPTLIPFSYWIVKNVHWKYFNLSNILVVTKSIFNVSKAFIMSYLANPIISMWKSLWFEENQLALLSAKSLDSDLESLQRMVMDFAQQSRYIDHDSQTIGKILTDAKLGDLTFIYKQYEKDIKNPIKSILLGDMLRLILIQIQKSKVDLEIAMTALDKLIKSNEFNLTLMTVIPSFLFIFWSIKKAISFFKNRNNLSKKRILSELTEILGNVERILTKSDGDSEMPLQMYGQLLLDLDVLRRFSKRLKLTEKEIINFNLDIKDLEMLKTLAAARKEAEEAAKIEIQNTRKLQQELIKKIQRPVVKLKQDLLTLQRQREAKYNTFISNQKSFNDRIEALKRRIQNEENNINGLQQGLFDLEGQITSCVNEMGSIKPLVDGIHQEWQVSIERFHKINDQIQSCEDKIKDLEGKLRVGSPLAIEEKIKACNGKREELMNLLEKEDLSFYNYTNDVDLLEKEIRDAEFECESMKNELNGFDQEILSINESRRLQEEFLRDCQRKYDESVQQLDEAKNLLNEDRISLTFKSEFSRREELETERSRLKDEIMRLQSRLEDVESQIVKFDEDVKWHEALNSAERDIEMAKNSYEEAQEIQKYAHSALMSAKDMVSRLSDSIGAKQQEKMTFTGTVNAASDNLNKKRSALDILKANLNQKRSSSDALKAEIERVDEMIHGLNKDLNFHHDNAKIWNSELEDLKNQRDGLKREAEDQCIKNRDLTQREGSLRTQLGNCERNINMLKSKIQSQKLKIDASQRLISSMKNDEQRMLSEQSASFDDSFFTSQEDQIQKAEAAVALENQQKEIVSKTQQLAKIKIKQNPRIFIDQEGMKHTSPKSDQMIADKVLEMLIQQYKTIKNELANKIELLEHFQNLNVIAEETIRDLKTTIAQEQQSRLRIEENYAKLENFIKQRIDLTQLTQNLKFSKEKGTNGSLKLPCNNDGINIHFKKNGKNHQNGCLDDRSEIFGPFKNNSNECKNAPNTKTGYPQCETTPVIINAGNESTEKIAMTNTLVADTTDTSLNKTFIEMPRIVEESSIYETNQAQRSHKNVSRANSPNLLDDSCNESDLETSENFVLSEIEIFKLKEDKKSHDIKVPWKDWVTMLQLILANKEFLLFKTDESVQSRLIKAILSTNAPIERILNKLWMEEKDLKSIANICFLIKISIIMHQEASQLESLGYFVNNIVRTFGRKKIFVVFLDLIILISDNDLSRCFKKETVEALVNHTLYNTNLHIKQNLEKLNSKKERLMSLSFHSLSKYLNVSNVDKPPDLRSIITRNVHKIISSMKKHPKLKRKKLRLVRDTVTLASLLGSGDFCLASELEIELKGFLESINSRNDKKVISLILIGQLGNEGFISQHLPQYLGNSSWIISLATAISLRRIKNETDVSIRLWLQNLSKEHMKKLQV
ncbi:NCA2-domain-containing protein [Rozella allomycis CSF55]|uniref:NCA2-domain-containing protein n=1 Tax=Rozella allomycis (strain CSF55) TaxID=988480 RepID=A0A075B255_ROZAC|nr:Nuclear control of ATP synthase 2 domain-containing protein [Rozella allomycis CSF55]RKP22090.1 NCA2-domain-containing protein [Rozella allomycis CSF55]|eukprot:EPZ36460.1 Nuclear control of ATP synthase 2 domain-containing protein [Rozella allomycis CSF55]